MGFSFLSPSEIEDVQLQIHPTVSSNIWTATISYVIFFIHKRSFYFDGAGIAIHFGIRVGWVQLLDSTQNIWIGIL